MKDLHYTYYNRNYHSVDNKGIKFHIILERYVENVYLVRSSFQCICCY